jgi:hypothetical protein
MAKTRSTAGRPHGSRPEMDPPVVEAQPPSACPSCGGTRRSEYWGKHIQDYAGLRPDGRPYRVIVRRRARCLDCGQVRIDKTYED